MLFSLFFAVYSTWINSCIDYSKDICISKPTAQVVDRVRKSENFMLHTKIKYCRWWAWPKCYDCSGILTSALQAWWRKFDKKLSSFYLYSKYKHIPFWQAKRWDILVTHDWKTHVALITKWYQNWYVTVIDYVDKWSVATYRKYSKIPNTVIIRLSR